MNIELIESTYKNVSKSLNEIYKKRKRATLFQKIMWFITGIYLLLLIAVLIGNYFPNFKLGFLGAFQSTTKNPYGNIAPYVFLIVILYPITYYFSSAFSKFKIKEQETIVQMIKHLFPQVEFSHNVSIPKKEIANSKIFSWLNNSTLIVSYGQIRNVINNNEVNIADVGIAEQNASNKIAMIIMSIPGLNLFLIIYQYILKNILSDKTADNMNYTYRGMFCWLSFPKKLQGHTVVLTNNQITKIDRASSFKFNDEQKVLLEDVRFTNKFVVYSTDQVEARYVLSTALMERIVDLEEKFKRSILISFLDQKMYLAIENDNGLFSFPSGKLDNIKIIEELAHDIETALQISESLKIK